MNKAFTSLLLAGTTALTACGGGGGGGGNNLNPVSIEIIGSLDVPLNSNGVVSALQQVAPKGVIGAKELVKAFEWADANKDIDTSELKNYAVKIDGVNMTLDKAWYMLLGYKKVYYDGKEDFWQGIVDSKTYDDSTKDFHDIKEMYLFDTDTSHNYGLDYADIGKADDFTLEKLKEQIKTDTGITIPDWVQPVEEPDTPVVDEPVDEVVDEVVEEPVVETGRTVENLVSTSEEVTTTVGDPVTVTTYVDTETSQVQENGDTIFTAYRTYTDTTTVTTVTKTVTTTNTTPVTTITYSDSTTETLTGETVVTTETNTVSKDNVTTSERTEVTNIWTVEAPVVEEPEAPVDEPVDEVVEESPEEVVTVVSEETRTEAEYWLRLDKEILPEEIKSTDTEVRTEGNYNVTYRVTTFVTPEIHTHVYATDTYTTTTYSDGSVVEELTNQALRHREPVTKYPVATERTEELELMREQIVADSGDDADNETDTGVIGEDHADMGTRTPGYVADRNHYRTDEFSEFKTTGLGNNHLLQSNFDVAYSRGWTGKGSLVVVADTGADTSHVDLDDNIAYTVDYTGNGISNASEHGTHVAGIIAAEKNDIGMHGAAFDAKLAVAKVADGYSYSFSNAIKAASWGNSLGAVAINVSAETRLDTGFKNNLVKDAHGVWHNTHWYYGTNGYNGAVNEAVKWKNALGNEMVLVKAAGNAGTDYSAGMNQMATATDANGNLILDGQMIIVGSYDRGNQYGNKAGTVCATYADGACQDAAKIKDFYILADGYMVDSTKSGGGYTNMTGTSMAAPVVSGSIAVLHQMWPHMKGKHLVQLVLVTAKKDVRNSYGENIYDDDLHGQGILDMDAATRPVGATGIPTSGRTDGGVSSVAGGANVSGVAAGQITALTNVMVLDSFERDFYIDLSGMVGTDIDTRTASVAEKMGAVNYFAGYMNNNQHVSVPFTIDENSNIEAGAGVSDNHYLGNSFSGTLGTSKSSSTVYANYNYRNEGFYAQAGLGITDVNFDTTNSMMDSADSVISSTWTMGYGFEPKVDHTWGFAVSQPVTVESAKFDYRVPTARTLDGNVVTQVQTVDFRNSGREIDLGTYYNFNLVEQTGLDADVKLFAEMRNTVGSLKKEIEKRAGISVQLKF
jgi:hypothetical protein